MHTHARRRAALAIALALAAATPAAVAFGIAKIGKVRVGGDAEGSDAGEVYTAAEGTERVYALFDFSGASRTDITVRVVANSLTVFEQTKRYNGDDTASVELSGSAIANGALASMSTNAEQLERSINELVADDDLIAGEAIEAVNGIERAKNQVAVGLPILEALPLGNDGDGTVASLRQALEDCADVIAAAQELPADDIAGRQGFGEELEPLAAEIGGAVDDLTQLVSDLGDVALPATGTDWSYDVSVRTATAASGNTAAGSARLVVAGSTSRGEDEPDEPTARPSATSRGNADTGAARGNATATPRAGSAASSGGATAPSNAAGDRTSGARATTAPGQSQASNTGVGAPADAEDDGAAGEGAEVPVDVAANAPIEAPADAEGPLAMGDPGAMPTWTVPAGRDAEPADVAPDSASGQAPEAAAAGGGPNFAVLGFGLALLVGIALWYRRRA